MHRLAASVETEGTIAGSQQVSPLSHSSLAAIRRSVVTSSDSAGWTSLLVERHRVRGHEYALQLPPTPDHTVVVGLRGGETLRVHGPFGTRTTQYSSNTVSFTAPDEGLLLSRRLGSTEARFEKINIYIPVTLIAEAQEELRPAGARTYPWPRARGGPVRDAPLQAMALGLVEAARWGAPDLYAAAAAQWLSVHLVTRYADQTRTGDTEVGSADRRIAAAVELIRSNYASQLTLDDMAAAANMSRFHFARSFQRSTGHPPHGYLIRVRLSAAAVLLRSTTLSVREIADRCGFSRKAYFDRVFLQVVGSDPLQYRVSGEPAIEHIGP